MQLVETFHRHRAAWGLSVGLPVRVKKVPTAPNNVHSPSGFAQASSMGSPQRECHTHNESMSAWGLPIESLCLMLHYCSVSPAKPRVYVMAYNVYQWFSCNTLQTNPLHNLWTRPVC
ncbi:hypothetical protein NKDENANG_04120 [Candidatus Entotheonellaceae bacterium PAL068K]